MDYDSKDWKKNAYVISKADLLPRLEKPALEPPSVFDLFMGAVYKVRSVLRHVFFEQ